MADDDPFFIVPAVQPDEEAPAAPSSKRTASPTATTRVSPVVPTPPVVTASTPRVTQSVASEPVADGEKSVDRRERPIRVVRRSHRRTTRVLRHVDPWSVFRVALVAHFVLYLVLLLTGVLLWNVANATGTVDNVERFLESFGWETFEFNGGELFHQAWILGLFLVVGLTGVAVLAATTFNLITDLVGGIRVTVLEVDADGAPEPGSGPSRSARLSRGRDRR